MLKIRNSSWLLLSGILLTLTVNASCSRHKPGILSMADGAGKKVDDKYLSSNVLIVLPAQPSPGRPFRVLLTGDEEISDAKVVVRGPSGSISSDILRSGFEGPCWSVYGFKECPAGRYKAIATLNDKIISEIEFAVATTDKADFHWKSVKSWDPPMETLYSAWINALFAGYDEQTSWTSLHKVTQNSEHNFLYNYLSLDEDDPNSKTTVTMQPDCADNPFYLRAYFAWKLGLPFGFHLVDRGNLSVKPKSMKWVPFISDAGRRPVAAFNNFLRRVSDGVQSGTARTALEDENSDYYPVALTAETLHPGTVFADPYGHTLILTGKIPQKGKKPGLLLSVDAQPDGTVGIKRFWKGNFLFNTTGVIGDPGFKVFRPIISNKGEPHHAKNRELSGSDGYVPFSLEQKKMKPDDFYRAMEKVINPEPLDPETALINLIQSLHEQLLVRVTSVANGEEYFRQHPGSVIPMPSSAPAIFQTGGIWEDFSTPNRDLRLLIAIDAILDFPERVSKYPQDFRLPSGKPMNEVKDELESLLKRKVEGLSITYTRSDGKSQEVTVAEIIQRREALEMAYNPNDGIEMRWGAPENSEERKACRRQAPAGQHEKMQVVRTWFSKRLHPPT
jgi:hypothetical protein